MIAMKPRITVITLGADTLEKSLHFYQDGLGLPTEGIACTEFEHGAQLLFLTCTAHDTFWGGYAGHFQDPDGHLWEIVWNPHWGISE